MRSSRQAPARQPEDAPLRELLPTDAYTTYRGNEWRTYRLGRGILSLRGHCCGVPWQPHSFHAQSIATRGNDRWHGNNAVHDMPTSHGSSSESDALQPDANGRSDALTVPLLDYPHSRGPPIGELGAPHRSGRIRAMRGSGGAAASARRPFDMVMNA